MPKTSLIHPGIPWDIYLLVTDTAPQHIPRYAYELRMRRAIKIGLVKLPSPCRTNSTPLLAICGYSTQRILGRPYGRSKKTWFGRRPSPDAQQTRSRRLLNTDGRVCCWRRVAQTFLMGANGRDVPTPLTIPGRQTQADQRGPFADHAPSVFDAKSGAYLILTTAFQTHATARRAAPGNRPASSFTTRRDRQTEMQWRHATSSQHSLNDGIKA